MAIQVIDEDISTAEIIPVATVVQREKTCKERAKDYKTEITICLLVFFLVVCIVTVFPIMMIYNK